MISLPRPCRPPADPNADLIAIVPQVREVEKPVRRFGRPHRRHRAVRARLLGDGAVRCQRPPRGVAFVHPREQPGPAQRLPGQADGVHGWH